jgi:tripartite ATP-independent transporter DctM subunit
MTLTALLVLAAILALAIPVAAGLGWLGLILNQIYSILPLTVTAGEVSWAATSSFILVAVPFYVLLGEIMLRSGIAESMYNAVVQWVSWLPGGLMHSNVVACALFAAISGSSLATAVTIGTVAIGEVRKRRYNERLFLGTIAAGGTLGILIPPSIGMIVYGAISDTSIPRLYMAGIIPGFILALAFMLTIVIACLWRKEYGGTPIQTDMTARIKCLPDLLPPVGIFIVVIGSIYGGLATATEAAALGIIAALVLATARRRLNLKVIGEILEGTIATTGMVMAIIIGSYFLNVVITAIGLPTKVIAIVNEQDLTPLGTLIGVVVFYVILGMVMETISMIVATIPITVPIVTQAGYDPVWFGVVVVLLMETSLLTPPIGMNLFVVQGIRERGQLQDVVIGSLPFIIMLFAMIALIIAVPQVALWLPSTMQ